MSSQQGSSHTQNATIQLEIIPEDASQQNLADVEEEGQDIINHIRGSGHTVSPAYTGRMGGPVYNIMLHTYHIIHDNKELLTAMFASLTSTLTLISSRNKKREKNRQTLFTSTPMPIEIIFQTENGPLIIKAADAESAVKTLAQLKDTQPEEIKKVIPQSCKLHNSVSYFWYCSMSYVVNCSAEKAVRYDREQVEKDGTEFSHLQPRRCRKTTHSECFFHVSWASLWRRRNKVRYEDPIPLAMESPDAGVVPYCSG